MFLIIGMSVVLEKSSSVGKRYQARFTACHYELDPRVKTKSYLI